MALGSHDYLTAARCWYCSGPSDGPHTTDCPARRATVTVAKTPVAPERQLLSTDSEERKKQPVYSGVIKYFPRALAAVARLSYDGNEKHNPGEPLHWSRHKSSDQLDCIARHLIDAGRIDPEDGQYHDTKLAWRALANLELLLERLAEKDAQ